MAKTVRGPADTHPDHRTAKERWSRASVVVALGGGLGVRQVRMSLARLLGALGRLLAVDAIFVRFWVALGFSHGDSSFIGGPRSLAGLSIARIDHRNTTVKGVDCAIRHRSHGMTAGRMSPRPGYRRQWRSAGVATLSRAASAS